MKWYLIPGLGTDARLFNNMADLLDDYEVIEHPVPHVDETIEQYALRLGAGISAGSPVVLGGVSFGGMLSAILSETLRPRAVVLMSSTHRPSALSRQTRAFEGASRILTDTMADWLTQITWRSMALYEGLDAPSAALFREMGRQTPLPLIRGAARMMMQWQRAPNLSCPRFHLHGSRDRLILCRHILPARVVPGAGHLLNLTHPAELRSFIQDVRRRLEA